MGDDGRVRVYLTDKIRRCIRTVLTKENLTDDLRKELLLYSSSRRSAAATHERRPTIPYELVKRAHEIMNKHSAGTLYLHELLEHSDIHLPEYEPPPRNPELEARCQKLRAEQADQEYRKMTKNVNFVKKPEDDSLSSIGKDIRSMNTQLLAVFNFLLTVGGAFVFGYKSVEYSMAVPNLPMQMCGGLILATVVFFADLYFLVKNTA